VTFLCVNNSNNTSYHYFLGVVDYLSNFRPLQGRLCCCLTQSLMVNPKIRMAKFDLKKLQISVCRKVQNIVWYLEPLRRDSRVWQTERRTDSLIAYAALHYVARSKTILNHKWSSEFDRQTANTNCTAWRAATAPRCYVYYVFVLSSSDFVIVYLR